MAPKLAPPFVNTAAFQLSAVAAFVPFVPPAALMATVSPVTLAETDAPSVRVAERLLAVTASQYRVSFPLVGLGASMTAMPRLPPATVTPKPPVPALVVRLLRATVIRVAPERVDVPSETSTVVSLTAKLADPVRTLKTLRFVSEPPTISTEELNWIAPVSTAIVTVAPGLVEVPSETSYVKLSVPLKPETGE